MCLQRSRHGAKTNWKTLRRHRQVLSWMETMQQMHFWTVRRIQNKSRRSMPYDMIFILLFYFHVKFQSTKREVAKEQPASAIWRCSELLRMKYFYRRPRQWNVHLARITVSEAMENVVSKGNSTFTTIRSRRNAAQTEISPLLAYVDILCMYIYWCFFVQLFNLLK